MIEQAYINALLSAAAYAKWDGPVSDIDATLSSKGFTDEQIARFKEDYTENGQVAYFDDTFPNGFAGVVFINRNTGERTVSFRGTEPTDLGDLFNDLLLAVGLQSFADFLDFGQNDSTEAFLTAAGLVDSSGNLLAELNTVDFVGHSLGGHLAIMAAYKYPDLVDQVSTFNGAGLQGWDELLNGLDNVLVDSDLDPSRVTNYFADKGVELTADHLLWFDRPGAYQNIFIEYNGPVDDLTVANHGIDKLVKSLSVYRVLVLIDPTLDSDAGVDKIYRILDGASIDADQSLESVVKQLGKLFGDSSATYTDDIELFYQSFLADSGELKPELQGLTIEDIAATSQNNLFSLSYDPDQGLAYRYALVNLNPFVVLGDDVIYEAHNANGELDLFDAANPDTAPNGMTEQYITDRSTFLYWKKIYAILDADGPGTVSDRTYIDWSSKLELGAVGGADPDLPDGVLLFGADLFDRTKPLEGTDKKDHIYGMAGNDIIKGHEGNDYIEGNIGDDRIYGGKGDDELYGGTGRDKYWYITGDGHDAIMDVDKEGAIFHQSTDGNTIQFIKGGFRENNSSSWTSFNPNVSYQWSGIAGEALTIHFRGEDGSITVNDFNDGDLGIQLKTSETYEEPVTNNIVQGDMYGPATNEYLHGSVGNDHIISGYGYDFLFGNEGDDVLDGGDHPDELLGGEGDDLLMGGSGNDLLQGENGNDYLQGDAGDDRLFSWNAFFYRDDEARAEGDLLEGGEGNDVLQGSLGDDRIYAGVQDDLPAALNSDDTVASNRVRDFLSGGAGNDQLVGSNGNDFLGGAEGDDFLVGGAGNDVILGDYELRTNSLDWDVYQHNTYAYRYDNVVRLYNDWEGDDVIYAGGGDDLVFANNGNDVVHGGSGNDLLVGHGGHDELSGGDGNDRLIGHGGSDILMGGRGNDELQGYSGDDVLDGGAGNDQYTFSYAADTGDDLEINISAGRSITIQDWFVSDEHKIECFSLYNPESGSNEDYDANALTAAAFRPRTLNAITDQVADEDASFEFTLPDGAFLDPDGDSSDLVITATMSDGSPLPDWLQYDEVSRTFSGVPETDDVGYLDLTVTATDVDGLSGHNAFRLTVNNTNDAPVLSAPIVDQAAAEGSIYNFTIPVETFTDVDVGDVVNLSATLSDGNVLPDWLSFNASTGTFTGTPAIGDYGDIEVLVTATDSGGVSIADTFNLHVNAKPEITAPDSIAVDEDIRSPLSISVIDGDNNTGEMQVNLQAEHGTLSLSTIDGLQFSVGDGLDDRQITFTGQQADINQALTGLTYLSDPDYAGTVTLEPVLLPDGLSLNDLDGSNGYRIDGLYSAERLSSTLTGADVSEAGDVNGDGFSDFIIGARASETNAISIVFGKADGYTASLDLATLDGTNGFTIANDSSSYGVGPLGNSNISGGWSIDSAGDVNADGYDDLIFTDHVVGSHIVYGRAAGFPALLDYQSFDGANGFYLNGSGLASTAAGIDDVNGDGIDDMLVDEVSRRDDSSVTSYVVYGRAEGFEQTVDLSRLSSNEGYEMTGLSAFGKANITASAGDVNGDGIGDIVLGDPGDTNSVYIVYGQSDERRSVNLLALDGVDGFRVDGIDFTGGVGLAASGVGDVNGDGLDDIIVGSSTTTQDGNSIGQANIIFGQTKQQSCDF